MPEHTNVHIPYASETVSPTKRRLDINLDCTLFRYGGSLGGPGATMTLGRKGHYASLRAARTADTDMPFLGPNQGQYATLSKGCKTLESSDFY
jgi:hypothetical protein